MVRIRRFVVLRMGTGVANDAVVRMRRFALVVTIALTAAFSAVQEGCSSSGGGGSGTGGSSGGNGGATATGGTGNGGASAGGASSGGTGQTGGAAGGVATGTGGAAGGVAAGTGGAAGGGATGTGGAAGAGGAGTGGGAGRAGSGGNAGSGGATCAECGFCPATPPTDGTPCALPSGFQYWVCTFTNDPDPACRPQSQCSCTTSIGAGCTDLTLATWQTRTPPTSCTTLDPGCGATPADACTAIAARCPYPDGTVCSCNQVGKPCAPLIGAPSGLVPPCPNVVPNAGTSCGLPDGTICGQNTCDIASSGFEEAVCSGGVWKWGNCIPQI
jgi:hypothetical protein